MADPFKNARAYYDVTVPSSGDGFSIAAFKNALQGLGFMDMIPLQPRAHSPADNKIMVRGRDASSFYNPGYSSDSNSRIPFASGDTPAFQSPASNPRIDIVYVTPSGDLKIQQGAEAASPTLPSLSPSGDTRMPVCAVWNRPGQARIVNFENKDSSTGDGYIYQDLRPWLCQPKAAGTTFSPTTPVAPTGDAQAGPGIASTSARSDHVHGGVHTIRKAGSSNLQGDVELAADSDGDLVQSGNRITHKGINLQASALISGTTGAILNSLNVATSVRNSQGNYTVTWQTAFADANYVLTFGLNPGTTSAYQVAIITQLAGSVNFCVRQTDNQSLQDLFTIALMAARA